MSQIIASGLSSDIDHQNYEISIDWDNQYFDIILTSESGLTFDDVVLGSVQIGSSYYTIYYESGQASIAIGSNLFILDEYFYCPMTIRFSKSNISIIKDDVEIKTGNYNSDHIPTTPISFINSTVVNDECHVTFDLVLGSSSKGEKVAEYKFNNALYDLIPEFNAEFIDYTYEDTVDGEVTTRTIYSDNLPTLMRFGTSFTSNKANSLLEVCYLNIDNVTDMQNMFQYCQALTSIDVSNWDTSNVTNMYAMFYKCQSLTTLDISNWDTSNVTNMGAIFYNCNNLTSIDVSNFNTSNATRMDGIFYNCTNLTQLDVSNFDTSNVTNMYAMFYGCNNLTTLDVSNFNTSNATKMYYMFYNCNNLTTLDVSNFNTSNVTTMKYMFNSCKKLTTLDISNWNTSNVTDMNSMFYDCNNLTALYASNWNTSNVTDMNSMFYDCNILTYIEMQNSDYSSVNKIISQLPTRTTDSMGALDITGTDDISQVDITTAESKFWNILNLKQYKVHLITINNNKVDKVYNLNKKLKISFYK